MNHVPRLVFFATGEAVEILMQSRKEITSVYISPVWYLFPQASGTVESVIRISMDFRGGV